MLKGQSANGGLENGWEKLRRDEAMWVVKDGVCEEAEEVFNNVRKLTWLEGRHHAQSDAGLRLEEVVNSIDGGWGYVVPILGELAQNSSGDPQEASLVRLLEARRKFLSELWEEWLHSYTVRYHHVSPAAADALTDRSALDKIVDDLRKHRENLLAVLDCWMWLACLDARNDPLNEDGEELCCV